MRNDGGGGPAWTYDRVVEIARRMEARAHLGFRVSAETERLMVEALRHYARERFGDTPAGYTVEVWNLAGDRIETHYADVNDFEAACDVFARAVRQRPDAYITLRQGIRVIERSRNRPRSVK